MHDTGEASVRARVSSLPAVLDSAAVDSCPGTKIDTGDDYIKGSLTSWSVLTLNSESTTRAEAHFARSQPRTLERGAPREAFETRRAKHLLIPSTAYCSEVSSSKLSTKQAGVEHLANGRGAEPDCVRPPVLLHSGAVGASIGWNPRIEPGRETRGTEARPTVGKTALLSSRAAVALGLRIACQTAEVPSLPAAI